MNTTSIYLQILKEKMHPSYSIVPLHFFWVMCKVSSLLPQWGQDFACILPKNICQKEKRNYLRVQKQEFSN